MALVNRPAGSSAAGKGDRNRVSDHRKYRANFDHIFRKGKKEPARKRRS